MKALGTTLFAIVLTMSPVAIVNAQIAAQPTTVPDVATKSDLRRATAGLSKELKRTTTELKAELARQAKAQADAQRAAEKAATDKRDADQKAELARQAKAQADADKTRNTIIGVVCISVFVLIGLLRMTAAKRRTAGNVTPAKSPTPEDLYGKILSPDQVRECLRYNKLKEGRFTIDLPIDRVMFDYRAIVMPDGKVMAYFPGNEKPVALEHQKLRKIAKDLWVQGKLIAVELKPTGMHRVA